LNAKSAGQHARAKKTWIESFPMFGKSSFFYYSARRFDIKLRTMDLHNENS